MVLQSLPFWSQAVAMPTAAVQSIPVYLKSWKASGTVHGPEPPVALVVVWAGFFVPPPEVVVAAVVVGIGEGEQLPLVAWRLSGDQPYDEFDVASQLASERGWLVPAYHLPPNAQEVKLMRALVKLTLGYSLAEKLVEDIKTACDALAKKGGVAEHERKRVHTGTGY